MQQINNKDIKKVRAKVTDIDARMASVANCVFRFLSNI